MCQYGCDNRYSAFDAGVDYKQWPEPQSYSFGSTPDVLSTASTGSGTFA